MKLIQFLLIAGIYSQTIQPTNLFTKVKQTGDWIVRNTLGYIDILETYHPYTKQYLQDLHEKYPAVFKNTSSYIFQTKGPCATFQSIYFPIYWVEKLEQEGQCGKKNGLFSQSTEWIALHEAGHIYNNDAAIGALGATIALYLKHRLRYHQEHQVKESMILLTKSIANGPKTIKTLTGLYVAGKIYRAVQEYRADDFATHHCTNPNSIAAAYEIIGRQASAGIMPGIRHSFKNFRLNRIASAYKEKFGHEIPKTYHATDRVTA